jgi:hypothetical protein
MASSGSENVSFCQTPRIFEDDMTIDNAMTIKMSQPVRAGPTVLGRDTARISIVTSLVDKRSSVPAPITGRWRLYDGEPFMRRYADRTFPRPRSGGRLKANGPSEWQKRKGRASL